MSNEVQPDISNVVVALLEELDNDFLADVDYCGPIATAFHA